MDTDEKAWRKPVHSPAGRTSRKTILRGTAGEVRENLAARAAIKGEITLIVSPPAGQAAVTHEALDAAIAIALQSMPAGKAAADVAKAFNLTKADVYARIIASKAAHD